MKLSPLTVLVFVPALIPLACSGSSNPPGTTPQDSGANPDTGVVSPDAGNPDDSGNPPDDVVDTGTEYDAVLSGAEVVPAVITASQGTAKFTLMSDGTTLNYDITQSVAGATGVGLHVGAPGETGATIHPITPVAAHMTGSITLAPGESDQLSAGMIYVSIESGAKPAGEVRGQLTLPGSEIFVVNCTGAQVVPQVATTAHAHASFIVNAGKDSARYHFFTDASLTDAHVDKAIASLNGPVSFPFSPIAQTIDGTLTLTASDASDLEEGRWYVTVVTAAHATGELRGQAIKPGETLFMTALSGAAEVPPVNTTATGGAMFILSPTRDQLRYEVDVNGIIPTAADLKTSGTGQGGTFSYSLTLAPNGALGIQALAPTDSNALDAHSVFVNIHTASNPTGELRGQLNRQ